MISLSLSYRCNSGRCLSESADLAIFLVHVGGLPAHDFNGLKKILFKFQGVIKFLPYTNSFFLLELDSGSFCQKKLNLN